MHTDTVVRQRRVHNGSLFPHLMEHCMHSRVHHQLTIRADSKESITVLSAEHTLNHLLLMTPARVETLSTLIVWMPKQP